MRILLIIGLCLTWVCGFVWFAMRKTMMRRLLLIGLCTILVFGVFLFTLRTLGGEKLNSDVGFSITFPKGWEGKWISTYIPDGVSVYDRTIQEKYGKYGLLFTVSRYKGEPQNGYAVPTNVIGTYNGYTYVFSLPSDMQYPDWSGGDKVLSFKYKLMTLDFLVIRRNIKLGDFTSSGGIELSTQ